MDFYSRGPWYYYHRHILKDIKSDFHIEGKDSLGSAADCLLTSPEEFNETFEVLNMKAIGGKTGEVIIKLSRHDFTERGLEFQDLPDEDIQRYCIEAEIAGGVKWFRSKVTSDSKYQEFYDKLVRLNTHGDKKIITSEIFEQAKAIQIQVLSDPIIGKYFSRNNEEFKTYYQVPVFFDYKGLQCKQLLDLVIVPLDGRSFVISDLKTTSKGIFNYEDTIIHQKLYLQGGFYSLPHIRRLRIKTPEKALQDLWDDKKAYLQDFIYLAVDSAGYEQPNEYSLGGLGSAQITQILEGGVLKTGEKTPGIDAILEEMRWHYDNQLWEHTREYYENKQSKLSIF